MHDSESRVLPPHPRHCECWKASWLLFASRKQALLRESEKVFTSNALIKLVTSAGQGGLTGDDDGKVHPTPGWKHSAYIGRAFGVQT